MCLKFIHTITKRIVIKITPHSKLLIYQYKFIAIYRSLLKFFHTNNLKFIPRAYYAIESYLWMYINSAILYSIIVNEHSIMRQ